jgi:hypothetical protein
MPRCEFHLIWDKYVDEMMRLTNEGGLQPSHPLVRQAQARSVMALRFAARDERDAAQNDYCGFETAEERTARMQEPADG